MLPFDEARRRVLAACSPLETEEIPVSAAAERVLAEDLSSERPLPAFDYSAMDGYAISARTLTGDPPYELPVVGEARAGGARPSFEPGTAVRIFTGAELPAGADAVVIQENTTPLDGRVRIAVPVREGDHVRRAGEDLPAGSVALSRGTRLGPFQLGLAAALDRATVKVARRPELAVLTTGDELRPPGSPGPRGSIPDSNSVAIRALAARAGALPRPSVHAPDDVDATARLLESLRDADVLVTLGGVSVGSHDVVRAALAAVGADLDFWKVAIKPGKPFTFGRLGRTLVLGLPGNPVSAQVTFALFGMPLLRALQGDRAAVPATSRVVLGAPVRQKPGRLGIYRARLEGGRALVHDNQASGSTVSLARADALVFVPADVSECPAGTELDAIRLAEL